MELYIALKFDSLSEDALTFPAENVEKLSKLNEEGYNIYKSINSFTGISRTKQQLEAFLGIGIDLDYSIGQKKELYQVIEMCQTRLGFCPTKINETYKGYHLFFDFSEQLFYLSEDSYVKCYNYINSILGGDPKMKHITGILKVEEYYDVKPGRDKFLIKTVYHIADNKITAQDLQKKGLDLIYKDKTLVELNQTKKEKKKMIKVRNTNDLDSVDALDFIETINQFHFDQEDGFTKHIDLGPLVGRNRSILGTEGLKVFREDDGFHTIKDFSGKGRYGIQGFFYNYYVDREQGDLKFRMFSKVIKEMGTGISLKQGSDKFSYKRSIIQSLITKDEDKVSLYHRDGVNAFQAQTRELNKKILENGNIESVLYGFLIHASENKINYYKEPVIIGETELLSMLQLGVSDNNKKNLRDTLVQMSHLFYLAPSTLSFQGEQYQGGTLKNVFEIGTFVNNKGKILYSLKTEYPNSKDSVIYLDKKILQLSDGLKGGKYVKLGSHITTQIGVFKTYTLSIDTFKEYTGITSTNDGHVREKIVLFLKKMKDIKLIKGYEKVTNRSFKIF